MKAVKHLLWFFGLLLLAGCGSGPKSELAEEDRDIRPTGGEVLGEAFEDLPEILRRGTLRLLIHRTADTYLQRSGSPLDWEREIVERFARQFGLSLEIIGVDAFEELIPALEAGRGDLIAANLTITPARKERILFSEAVGTVDEILVSHVDLEIPEEVGDVLRKYPISVRRGTSFEETLRKLQESEPRLKIEYVSSALSQLDLYDRLEAKKLKLLVTDSNIFANERPFRPKIKPLTRLGERRELGWAIRPGAHELKMVLDRFIADYTLTRGIPEIADSDLPGIQEAGRIRMITRNNSITYFLYRGETRGFEYLMGRAFADALGVRLEVVVAPSNTEMFSLLEEGKGDFIAAFTTKTAKQKERGFSFSEPYMTAREVLVGGKGRQELVGLDELEGLVVSVRPSSSHYQTLVRMVDELGIGLRIRTVGENTEAEELLQLVGRGELEATVVDDFFLNHAQLWQDDLVPLLRMKEPLPVAWVFRKDNPELKEAADLFWEEMVQSTEYKQALNRYFGSADQVRQNREAQELLVREGRVSPYDEIIREKASQHSIDWRLVTAQMFQESRFDPMARSRVGAEGLMQIMPRTAGELGLKNPYHPEANIEAGIRYLNWVKERLADQVLPEELPWFALAAYNAGLGHVFDAQRLAEDLGYDPRRWFDHTEEAMLRLAEVQYYGRVRHGYVRGAEPVDYVRKIREHYQQLVSLVAE
ncbi:MAG: transporter substrate-binding domain-containing protein [Puniceicoccaceae bacterium]